jgi:hypothetical protein
VLPDPFVSKQLFRLPVMFDAAVGPATLKSPESTTGRKPISAGTE